MNYPVIAILLAALLAACSSSTDEEEDKVTAKTQEIENAIHEPLDKAKAAEEQILDNADLQRKQMDDL